MENEGGSNLMKFGENLYKLRKDAKMNQEKLAEEVGVSRQSVSKWENGESYPEMENILKLCEIFHCKINDLVHENMQDIDSLDEDIKMNVVKLEKEKQKKLKIISKIIFVIAKIAKILTRVAVVCVAIAAIIGVIMVNMITVKDGKYLEINTGNQIVEYKEVDGEMVITGNDENNEKVEFKVMDIETKEDLEEAIKIFDRGTKASRTVYVIVGAVFIEATLVLLGITLGHLEKLFKNINEGDTPFTLENVGHIKKMVYFMIAVTVVSAIGSIFTNLLIGENADINVGFSLINILFLYSISIIFEYGYNIQQESQGKIYGDENE